jgi:hypothetical protein
MPRSIESRQAEQDLKEALKYEGLAPEQIRAIQERNYATSLKVWWGRDFGVLAVLDPFSGEVYEVEYRKEGKGATPKWLVWRAMDEKQRRRPRNPGVPPAGRGVGAAPRQASGPVPAVAADERPAGEELPVVW